MADTAFQEEAFSDITVDAYGAGVFFTAVPPGKRLVVEHISVRAELPPGQTARAAIVVGFKKTDLSHYLVMESQGTVIGAPTNRAVFVASQPIRMYADHSCAVNVERDSADDVGVAYATVSGYFVDLP